MTILDLLCALKAPQQDPCSLAKLHQRQHFSWYFRFSWHLTAPKPSRWSVSRRSTSWRPNNKSTSFLRRSSWWTQSLRSSPGTNRKLLLLSIERRAAELKCARWAWLPQNFVCLLCDRYGPNFLVSCSWTTHGSHLNPHFSIIASAVCRSLRLLLLQIIQDVQG